MSFKTLQGPQMTSYFTREDGLRLFAVMIPNDEAHAMGVSRNAVLVIRMDVHPRTSCVIVPGAPIASAFDRLGLRVETESAAWLGAALTEADLERRLRDQQFARDHQFPRR